MCCSCHYQDLSCSIEFINREGILKFHREEEWLTQLKDSIDKHSSPGDFAVLDADGTLWPEDANDILLNYQIRENLRDVKDLMDSYYRQEGHRYLLCENFAKRQKGWSIEEFQFHARKALKEKPLHVFPFQKKLLDHLKHKALRICIVTASIKWLVELAVEIYELPIEKVLGVETKIKGGLISSEILRPAPVGDSKGSAFLNYSQGKSCFLAGGNTLTDLPLLKMAVQSFVVHSADSEDTVFSAEERLKAQALQEQWIVFEKERE